MNWYKIIDILDNIVDMVKYLVIIVLMALPLFCIYFLYNYFDNMPSYDQMSCTEIYERFNRCVADASSGKKCSREDNVIIPAKCRISTGPRRPGW